MAPLACPVRSSVLAPACGLLVPLLVFIAIVGARPAAGATRLSVVRAPVMVELPLNSIPELLGSMGDVDELRLTLARQIVDAAREQPGRLIALRLEELPLSFDRLARDEQTLVRRLAGEQLDPRVWYERRLAELLTSVIREARQVALFQVSVVGLPFEGAAGGPPTAETNAEYASLMAGLDAFVTTRTFIRSDSRSEITMVRRSLPGTLEIAGGRPVLFRCNRAWHTIADDEHLAAVDHWDDEILDFDPDQDALVEGTVPQVSYEPERLTLGIEGEYVIEDAGGFAASDGGAGGGGGSRSGGGGGGGGGGARGGGGGGGGGGGLSGGGGSGGGGSAEGSGGGGGGGGGLGRIGRLDELPTDGGGLPSEEGFEEEEQEEQEEEEQQSGVPELLTVLDSPAGVRDLFDDLGIGQSLIMGGWGFDPEGTGRWTRPDRTDYWLRLYCPEDFDGLLTIDWETGFTILLEGPAHPEWSVVVGEMLRLINYVSSQRPLAKIGYYGVPVAQFSNQSESWRETQRALRPLYDASSALVQRIYNPYPDDQERDNEQFGEIVRFTLEMAEEKPVYLYSYHRHANTDWHFILMRESEYVAHLNHLVNLEYAGRRPAGVVAWGADRYYYNSVFETDEDGQYIRDDRFSRMMRDAFLQEMDPDEAIDDYLLERLYPLVFSRFKRAVTYRDE